MRLIMACMSLVFTKTSQFYCYIYIPARSGSPHIMLCMSLVVASLSDAHMMRCMGILSVRWMSCIPLSVRSHSVYTRVLIQRQRMRKPAYIFSCHEGGVQGALQVGSQGTKKCGVCKIFFFFIHNLVTIKFY